MAELQAVIPAQEQIIRRNRPGTKAEDMYNWPDQDVDEMDTVLAGKDHTYYTWAVYARTTAQLCETGSCMCFNLGHMWSDMLSIVLLWSCPVPSS